MTTNNKKTEVIVAILLLRAIAIITMWHSLVVYVKNYYGWGLFITVLLALVNFNINNDEDDDDNK